jgi:hypothetical protein
VVAGAESFHGRLSLGEGSVGVKFTGVVTHFANDDGKLTGTVAGASEDQGRTLFVQQQLLEDAALVVVADVGDFLLNQFTGCSLRRDFDAGGVSHVAQRQLFDFLGHRRAEQQGLASFRSEIQQSLDDRGKAHVQHSVGFIQNHRADAAETDGSLHDVIH